MDTSERGAPVAGSTDLLHGAIGPALIVFALPTLASSILQSASGSFNAIWVGRFLGEAALAATANGNIIMFLLLAFVFGFGMASTILIGQAMGRTDTREARRIAGTAVGSFVPVVIILCMAGWIYAPQLIAILGTDAATSSLALDYLRVIFVALPFMMTFSLVSMALRGVGNSKTPLVFMGLSVILDSGLNPLLIAGLGPFPELGIRGAALATVIANLITLPAMVVYLYWNKSVLALQRNEVGFLLPNLALMRTIVAKGLPIGLQMIVISSAALSMLRLVNAEGVETTSAYAVVQQLWTYVQMPAMAIGGAVSAMAAQNIGAGQWDRVGRITRNGIIFSVVLTVVLIGLILVFDTTLIGFFLGADSGSTPIAERILVLSTWGFAGFAVGFVIFGVVRANGEVIMPLIILTVAMYPVRLGFAYAAYPFLGADALWWSFPVSMMSIFLMATALYLKGNWRHQALPKPPTRHECEEHGRNYGDVAGRSAA